MVNGHTRRTERHRYSQAAETLDERARRLLADQHAEPAAVRRNFDRIIGKFEPAGSPTWSGPPPRRWHSCNLMSRRGHTQIIEGKVDIERCECGGSRLVDTTGRRLPTYWEGKNSRRRRRTR
jgi:hypothetical protein